MAKTLSVNAFSVKSIRQIKKELEKYRDSLQGKLETFVNILLEEGISVAYEHSQDIGGAFGTHKMGQQGIAFNKEVNTADGKIYGVLIGTGNDVVGYWYMNNGKGVYTQVSDTINALMVLEFGTAGLALEVQNSFGVVGGQGTKSKCGHENDYAWKIITRLDSNGNPVEWKNATAIQPTRPMYQAGLAMCEKVKEAARVAFGS